MRGVSVFVVTKCVPIPGLQVWQDVAKPQILRVQPFEPHRQAAAAGMSRVSDLEHLRDQGLGLFRAMTR